jgi:hypothetical protein
MPTTAAAVNKAATAAALQLVLKVVLLYPNVACQ